MIVRYRDVQHTSSVPDPVLLFVTPVVYPLSAGARALAARSTALNPMVGVLETFRWAVLGGRDRPGTDRC